MDQPIRTTSPAGEPIVILSAHEYERLLDLAEAKRDIRAVDGALADYRGGRSTALTCDEMEGLLAATTPLAFWRRKRGASQAALAAEIGCSQPYLQQLEAGERRGTLPTFRKLATALGVSVDDLDIPRAPAIPSRALGSR